MTILNKERHVHRTAHKSSSVTILNKERHSYAYTVPCIITLFTVPHSVHCHRHGHRTYRTLYRTLYCTLNSAMYVVRAVHRTPLPLQMTSMFYSTLFYSIPNRERIHQGLAWSWTLHCGSTVTSKHQFTPPPFPLFLFLASLPLKVVRIFK